MGPQNKAENSFTEQLEKQTKDHKNAILHYFLRTFFMLTKNRFQPAVWRYSWHDKSSTYL